MDSGWAAILGSIVGGLGTFAATWLSAYLNRKQPDPSEEAAKKLLLTMLDRETWGWASIDTLANVVGTDHAHVRKLLLEIGARGSMRDGNTWGLISRNPIGDAKVPDDDPDHSI